MSKQRARCLHCAQYFHLNFRASAHILCCDSAQALCQTCLKRLSHPASKNLLTCALCSTVVTREMFLYKFQFLTATDYQERKSIVAQRSPHTMFLSDHRSRRDSHHRSFGEEETNRGMEFSGRKSVSKFSETTSRVVDLDQFSGLVLGPGSNLQDSQSSRRDSINTSRHSTKTIGQGVYRPFQPQLPVKMLQPSFNNSSQVFGRLQFDGFGGGGAALPRQGSQVVQQSGQSRGGRKEEAQQFFRKLCRQQGSKGGLLEVSRAVGF